MEGCVEWVGAGNEEGGSEILEHTVEPFQCHGPNSTKHHLLNALLYSHSCILVAIGQIRVTVMVVGQLNITGPPKLGPVGPTTVA